MLNETFSVIFKHRDSSFAEAKQMAEAQLNQAKAMAQDKCSIQ